jgi:hypothetical protein
MSSKNYISKVYRISYCSCPKCNSHYAVEKETTIRNPEGIKVKSSFEIECPNCKNSDQKKD